MPRPDTTRARLRAELSQLTDVRDVIGSVNATLDAILAATMPLLALALARRTAPAQVHDPREDSESGY